MPLIRSLSPSRTAMASACVIALVAVAGPAAANGSTQAEVRVVSTAGRELADLRQFTDTTNIKTDPRADCFGPGSGGSGRVVTVSGPTALGAVYDAQATEPELEPVSVTDAFGFGLGVCGFGERRADSTHFWYLKVNHVESSVGGDQVKLKRGDEVLWYLIPTSSCPPPDFFCVVSDLRLEAPARVRPNQPFTVRVSAFSRAGVPVSPAGAIVFGGTVPAAAGPDGVATLTLPGKGTKFLHARRGNDIPSGAASVCAAKRLKRCPRNRGKVIAGSDFGETINGTAGRDNVAARGGDDRILVRRGDRDKVKCGGGMDVAKVDRRDKVGRSCERVLGGRKGKRK
jgi:hypothetical protein